MKSVGFLKKVVSLGITLLAIAIAGGISALTVTTEPAQALTLVENRFADLEKRPDESAPFYTDTDVYQYTIYEQNDAGAGYAYEDTVYHVKVDVDTRNNGQLYVTVTGFKDDEKTKSFEFINTCSDETTVSAEPEDIKSEDAKLEETKSENTKLEEAEPGDTPAH